MDVEEVNVLCDQLKQKTINMEKELVCYMRAKNCWGPPEIVSKLTSVSNDLNKLAIKLHQIKEGDYEFKENGLKN